MGWRLVVVVMGGVIKVGRIAAPPNLLQQLQGESNRIISQI